MDRINPQHWQQENLRKPQNVVTSVLGQDPAYCLRKAQLLFGCYRKDEAHDPETYSAAIAAIFQGFPKEVVDRAADPRTGVASICKWLPSVAEVMEFCNGEQARQYRMSQPISKSGPREEMPRKPGQYTYAEFLLMAESGKVKSRPIGRFEK